MESRKGEIVMYQLNDVVELDVRLEDETVWLTQQQMSELFSEWVRGRFSDPLFR